MSDDQSQAADQPAEDTQAPLDLPEEWKPEPREWTWRDLFTAPMLAFKPKCMLISALTIIAMSLFAAGWAQIDSGDLGQAIDWIHTAIQAIIFSIGATFVAIFMKADLLDDEFLSFKEAAGQFKGRLKAAILVPAFLVIVLAGFNLLMYLAQLVGSIPLAGSLLYALLYPLGFLLMLFIILLGIGLALAIFVGPAVIAVRRHSWFDNVIDTFEAVGTKPHVLVASLIITTIMISVCSFVGFGAMGKIKEYPTVNNEIAIVEAKSEVLNGTFWSAANIPTKPSKLPLLEYLAPVSGSFTLPNLNPKAVITVKDEEGKEIGGWYSFTGGVLTFWKLLITGAILGYLFNIFVSGGLLTYLNIREDDYWDDEDLEDLDKLAKELEEEAKRDAEAAEAASKSTESTTEQTDEHTETAKADSADDSKEGAVEATDNSKKDENAQLNDDNNEEEEEKKTEPEDSSQEEHAEVDENKEEQADSENDNKEEAKTEDAETSNTESDSDEEKNEDGEKKDV